METSIHQDRSYSKNVKIKSKIRKKKKRINFKKIGIVLVTACATAGVGFVVYSHLPFVKVSKAIAAGDKYAQASDYEAAIKSYSDAIEIDNKSVTAYSNMAGAYLSIDDSESAKNTLHEGWENTGDETLLANYHAVILNDVVEAMNDQKADMSTVMDIVSVLSDDNSNANAIELLNSSCERVFTDAYSYNENALFFSDSSSYSSEGGSSTFSFQEYEAFIDKLLDIYKITADPELGKAITSYATPGNISFTMKTSDVQAYDELLGKIEENGLQGDNISSMRECLQNSQSVLEDFSEIFAQLDVGNVDELRNFVVSDKFLSLRDIFLHEEYTPQENTTYIPISREGIILNNNDGKWSYRFLDFEENHDTKGVITVWANFFEDSGIQRNAISYEPAAIEGNYYPHTKYSVTYLYSYITSGGSTKVAKMNYRLDTLITTESGEEIQTVVGDWGGENEWTMDIDTIESRIKA